MRKIVFGLVVLVVATLAGSSWALFGQSRTFQSTVNIRPVNPHPIGITPTTGSIVYTVPSGSPIANLVVSMSDGTHFNGALTVSDGTGIVCGVSPCSVSTSLVTARTMTGPDVGAHTLRLMASAAGQTFTQPFTLIVTQPTFTGIALSNSVFNIGASSTVGTASATFNVGTASPVWSIKTSGVDSATGATCNNYSFFSINSSTGIVTANASAPAQSFPGTCLQATISATNSPFSKAFTLTGQGGGTNPATTFTFVNDTGSTLPAGTAVTFGQAFRYDDIPANSYPLIRDASTHVALPGMQWDERSTWIENGGDGSWRHAVWAAWLPVSVGVGATYQVEFVSTPGTSPATSRQPLTALCSGPAAHDLKIHLTNVRNQDNTARDTGDATFRVCDNIANTGRDAPRHLRQGNVYDEYLVSGMFVYTGAGHKDPLLYAQAIIDISTKSSDGVSAGDVRWVFHVHNSWENVAAGSIGNAGNPGPVGFTNDPQTIFYKVEIDDGASDVLDWSNLGATVTSANNPIGTSSGLGCDASGSAVCMSVPSSTGANQWYYGEAVRASCSATCVAGLTTDQVYYVYPASSVVSSNTATTGIQLTLAPTGSVSNSAFFMTSAQGTGTTAFTPTIPHYHWSSWQTLDATGLSNLSPFGTTNRVTKKVYPAFTATEKRYWESTGLIIPLNINQTPNVQPAWRNALGPNYEPYGRMNVIGFSGGGLRPDLGIVGEWASQAFITGAQHDWDNARLFTLGTSTHGTATLLNEATGRLPALNNGPPTGPGGNGVGWSYAGLGAPQPNVTLNSGGSCTGSLSGHTGENLADVPLNLPNASFPANLGQWGCGTYISHMPSFNGFTYEIFGDRHFLDVMRWHGNQDYLQQRAGPGPSLGQGYYRDNNASFNGTTTHYYGLLIDCCQTRGSAHLFRDIIYPATFGSDADPERSYFHDFPKETSNYYPLWLKFKDGSGNPNYSTSILTPDAPGQSVVQDTFIQGYVNAEAAHMMVTFLHEPLGSQWMTKYQRFEEGVLGGQLPGGGAPISYYGIDFNSECCINNGDDGTLTSQSEPNGVGNFGPAMNGTDATDFGAFAAFGSIQTGGQLGATRYTYTAGDFLKPVTAFPLIETQKLDQLNGNTWYKILGPVNNNSSPDKTFFLQCPSTQAAGPGCPTPGAAFTFFSRGGVTVNNELHTQQFKYRLQFDPGPGQGYSDTNYDQYGGQILSSLKILGYSVPNALADFASRDGGNTIGAASPGGFYNPVQPSTWWDQTIVIPGLPTAVNGLSGGGIVCDIGPNYTGAVPAGAQAAGFTHCAANYDFTAGAYASLSNWLDCAGAASPQWYTTPTNGGGIAAPCARYVMEADGANPQVLHEKYLTTDGASSIFGTTLTTTNASLSAGQTFPLGGAYWQATYRIPASTYAAAPGTGIVWAWWSWNEPQNNVVEEDFEEHYANGSGAPGGAAATWHNVGSPGFTFSDFGNGGVPGFDPTVYNTYGTRLTFDGTTVEACAYLNGVLTPGSIGGNGCSGTIAQTPTNRRYPILMLGPQGSPSYTPSAQQDVYIKQVTIFTCATWQTTECPTTLLTGPP